MCVYVCVYVYVCVFIFERLRGELECMSVYVMCEPDRGLDSFFPGTVYTLKVFIYLYKVFACA